MDKHVNNINVESCFHHFSNRKNEDHDYKGCSLLAAPLEIIEIFVVDFPEKLCVATKAFHFALWSGNCDISTTMAYLHVVGTA